MPIQVVLLPLFVEIILTFMLLAGMGVLRNRDLRDGAVTARSIALREPNWPARTTQVANAFANQFELPVLFYVLTILEIITRHADLVFVVLAWVFVLSRIGHAYIHTSGNVVTQRGAVYGIGMLVLVVMWLIFMVRIMLGLG
jgi:hypothetical protein